MAEEQLNFQAEVSRLLDIVAHSLYSEKEIFLRELISNAADACDRLRHAALTQSGLLGDDSSFHIRLKTDPAARTLVVSDNGIGMNRQELIDNRSEEHTSELQSLMRISYAVFCLKKKNNNTNNSTTN